jgi:FMN phosphatase YigB (HAD superfamily)
MQDADAGLLVLDVDNTIYDWLAIWARAFGAMTQVLVAETGRDATYWRAAIRDVHVRRHALECSAALEDLAADSAWQPFRGREETALTRAAGAYRRAWDTHLAPYDGIRASLIRLAENGWRVVAYTESDAAIAACRLSRMGLAGVIPRVFGRAPLSTPTRREWTLVEMPTRLAIAIDHVPRADLKPNPGGLHDIVARCDTPLWRTVYVGDNRWTDIAMAQRLGVRALWAEYGTTRRREHVELLARVTQWSPNDASEERASSTDTVTPDVTLRTASDLVDAVAAMPAAMG